MRGSVVLLTHIRRCLTRLNDVDNDEKHLASRDWDEFLESARNFLEHH